MIFYTLNLHIILVAFSKQNDYISFYGMSECIFYCINPVFYLNIPAAASCKTNFNIFIYSQVPQYLIGAGWSRIVCTQPRRLSTVSLSERVAKEMYCEETGDVRFGSGDERRSGTRSASRAAAAGGS